MHHCEAFRRYLIRSPILPAPMCGYSERPFRDLLRRMGAHLVYTEMLSSEALVRGDPKTWRLMDFMDEDPPVAVQIFGSRPAILAEAARIAVRKGAAVIDLNMGCPVKKVTRAGCGAALAEDLERARAVCRAMRGAVDVPFTAKIRWQTNGGANAADGDARRVPSRAITVARMCEDEGLDAVAIHARTRAQGYSGTANWDWIAQIKKWLSIPVIGNGDVWTAADAARMRAETGCDAVMVGRGLVGNPWLVRQVALYDAPARAQRGDGTVEDGPATAEGGAATAGGGPSPEERLRVLLEHARLMVEHGGNRGLIEFRKHCAGYIRGLPGARAARPELMQATTLDQLKETLERRFGEMEW
jgi:nifR3 family TIM-barrel protein